MPDEQDPETTLIVTSTEFGARVARRLRQEAIVWLTTVRHDLTPQPSPVWFLWDGETFLIYSQPDTQKLRNIARSPKVALHLHTDAGGGDVVVFTGEARIVPDAPPAHEVTAFAQKYQEIGAVPNAEQFERTMDGYSVAIRVTPTALRGF